MLRRQVFGAGIVAQRGPGTPAQRLGVRHGPCPHGASSNTINGPQRDLGYCSTPDTRSSSQAGSAM